MRPTTLFRHRVYSLGLALAVCVGCGPDQPLPADTVLPELASSGGPESILLRFADTGGLVQAYRYPTLDSAVWVSADKLPAISRVLGFDDGGGLLALQDATGHAVRLDLRTGRVFATDSVFRAAASGDGWSIVGLVAGRLTRTTPSGLWRGPAVQADTVLASPTGDVIAVRHSDVDSRFVRFRPPATAPIDSVTFPRVVNVTRTVNGDRWYLQTAEGNIAVESRTLATAEAPPEDSPRAIVATPSGDRVATLSADGFELRIWERYGARVSAKISLSRGASDLRMDELGRFLLVRDEGSDSVHVISVPLAGLVGSVASRWRDDLPTVTPDGALLVLDSTDVILRAIRSDSVRARIAGGAAHRWMFVHWDGFRPRDRRLDRPVEFTTNTPADSAAEAEAIDSLLAAASRDVTPDHLMAVGRADTGAALVDDSAAAAAGYTLAFASLLSESRARALAGRIRVDGRAPRVVVGSRDGVASYRVVSGPFPTREAAEAAGRRSGVSFWVFAGLP